MTQVLVAESHAPRQRDVHDEPLDLAVTSSPAVAAPGAEDRIELVQPLLGFPRSLHFSLAALGPRYAPFVLMTSLEEAGLDFIVVAPGLLFEDYVIEIAEQEAAIIGVASEADVEVLVLVSRHRAAVPTVNLMGPLVVNRTTRAAIQLVLQDGRYGAAVAVDNKSASAST